MTDIGMLIVGGIVIYFMVLLWKIEGHLAEVRRMSYHR
jgi:hypothetical protein